MLRYISIFYATVLAAIFLFPTNGKTIPEDYQANEPAEKQNQNKASLIDTIFGNLIDQRFNFVLTYNIFFLIFSISWKYLLVQINGPTKAKPRQLAASIAQAGIGIGQAIFCKGNRQLAAAQTQAPAASQAQAPAAAQAQPRNLQMLGTIGKALFC